MKKSLFLLFVSFLLSCSTQVDGPVVLSTSTSILLVDEEQNNLLENGVIDGSKIRIFYIINEEKKLFFDPALDYSKGYEVLKYLDNQNVLKVFLNTDTTHPVTLIEYKEGDIDTLTCDFFRNDGMVICKKISVNGVLKWEVDNSQYKGEVFFKLVK